MLRHFNILASTFIFFFLLAIHYVLHLCISTIYLKSTRIFRVDLRNITKVNFYNQIECCILVAIQSSPTLTIEQSCVSCQKFFSPFITRVDASAGNTRRPSIMCIIIEIIFQQLFWCRASSSIATLIRYIHSAWVNVRIAGEPTYRHTHNFALCGVWRDRAHMRVSIEERRASTDKRQRHTPSQSRDEKILPLLYFIYIKHQLLLFIFSRRRMKQRGAHKLCGDYKRIPFVSCLALVHIQPICHTPPFINSNFECVQSRPCWLNAFAVEMLPLSQNILLLWGCAIDYNCKFLLYENLNCRLHIIIWQRRAEEVRLGLGGAWKTRYIWII